MVEKDFSSLPLELTVYVSVIYMKIIFPAIKNTSVRNWFPCGLMHLSEPIKT
jgi:hypothetical protein